MIKLPADLITELEIARYFREEFAKIPPKLWTTGDYVRGERHCALGHCGARTATSNATVVTLQDLFSQYLNFAYVTQINDGNEEPWRCKQTSAKARILAALDEIIAKLEKE